MIRLMTYLTVLLYLGLCGPVLAQGEQRPIKEGPDFSGLPNGGVSENGELQPWVKSNIERLRKLDPRLAAKVERKLKRTNALPDRIRYLIQRGYKIDELVDDTERAYADGSIRRDAFENTLKVSECFSNFLENCLIFYFNQLRDLDDETHDRVFLDRLSKWKQRYAKHRAKRRVAMGLHKIVGRTPGPDDKRQMKNVCAYISSPDGSTVEHLVSSCYEALESQFCTRIVEKNRKPQCSAAIKAAKTDGGLAAKAILDFCSFLPNDFRDHCYKFGVAFRGTCAISDNNAWCFAATSTMPEDARLE